MSAKYRPSCFGPNVLTHWGRYKMTAILQTAFSNSFSLMNISNFDPNHFHWNIFQYVQLTRVYHLLREWLGAEQAAIHHMNQWWPTFNSWTIVFAPIYTIRCPGPHTGLPYIKVPVTASWCSPHPRDLLQPSLQHPRSQDGGRLQRQMDLGRQW